ncbi:MAG: hypothetical protein GXY61_05130 [Lentisphaerae bacterium]|nr:hypothetical protein [Lentisphaerota bacterium]
MWRKPFVDWLSAMEGSAFTRLPIVYSIVPASPVAAASHRWEYTDVADCSKQAIRGMRAVYGLRACRFTKRHMRQTTE